MTRTGKRRILFFLSAIPLAVLSFAVLRGLVARTIIGEDANAHTRDVVIENWSGDVELFSKAMDICEREMNPALATIIFESNYVDSLRRGEILEAAWDGGIDTTKLRLIRVPLREPRTLNIANAVVDSLHAWEWNDVTIITAELHSARSRKAYQIEAERHGIRVYVMGVPYSNVSSENWYKSVEGVMTAAQEVGKRLYYELVVF